MPTPKNLHFRAIRRRPHETHPRKLPPIRFLQKKMRVIQHYGVPQILRDVVGKHKQLRFFSYLKKSDKEEGGRARTQMITLPRFTKKAETKFFNFDVQAYPLIALTLITVRVVHTQKYVKYVHQMVKFFLRFVSHNGEVNTIIYLPPHVCLAYLVQKYFVTKKELKKCF